MKKIFPLIVVTILFSIHLWGQSSRIWATYYGGPGNENGSITGTATDASNNVYLCGTTASSSGIASGGFQNTLIGTLGNAYLVKFDASGNRLWATYYGNTGGEYGTSVATDALGNVYLAGTTSSATGIASGGHDNTLGGGSDAFLVKFDASGNRLWATYYGGTGNESSAIIETDASNNVYLCGPTSSTTSIASGGHQNAFGGGTQDGYLVKFNAAGVRQWATYYGGTGDDQAFGIAIDASTNVFLIGTTSSTTSISSGGFQNAIGGGFDSYLVKFNSTGVRQWATYYGGANTDLGNSIVCDPLGNPFLCGYTSSTSNISSGGFQNTFGGGTADNFLVKFNTSGSRLWATYYGGTGDEYANYQALVTDAGNDIYMGGTTTSTNAMASGGFQNTFVGGSDAYLVEFDMNGNRLVATYYGDVSNESGYAIGIDNSGKLYQCGLTMSTSNIASGGFQNTHAGGTYDAFLVKFDPVCLTPTQPTSISGPTTVCNGATNTYSITTVSGATSYTWVLPGGWSGTSTTNSINATASSTGGTISVTANNACGSSTAQTLSVSVNNVSTGMMFTPALCNGSCNGDAMSMPTGTGPFTYLWNNTQTGQTATGLCVGNYTVTVTGAGGCTATGNVTVTQPTAVTATAGANPSIMCVGNCAQLTIGNVSGGTAPYTYMWVPGNMTGSSVNVCPTTTTCYTLNVTDANGCTATALACVTVNQLPNVTYSQTVTNMCSTWPIQTLSPGSPGGGVYSGTAVTGNTFDPSVSGTGTFTITYTYTDVNGCTNFATSQITVGLCTGTNQPIDGGWQFVIFPNPFNEIVTIECDHLNGTAYGEVFNLLGEKISSLQITDSKTELDLSDFQSGVYFIKIKTNDGVVTRKIVKE